MSQLRSVLVVDDDANDAELTFHALKVSGIKNPLLHLRDGQEALDYLYRKGDFEGREDPQPGVIILDLKMPRVDGHEVLVTIKGDPALKRIPVIVMTSSREEQDVCRGYDNGANAYVVKPIDFRKFTYAIRELGIFWALINEAAPSS